MASREQVWAVIIEYAVKQRYHTLTQVLLQKTSCSIRIPDIYQVLCVFEKILITGRLDQFELAAQLIEMIYQLDDKICSFKVYSKLMLGIKMKFLLEYLKSNDQDVETKLNKHLPVIDAAEATTMNKEHNHHEESITSFREFFIPLIHDKVSRDRYFREEYETEFGEEFLTSFKRLLNSFIVQVIHHLPETKLEMLFSRKYDIKHIQGHQELQRLLKFLQGIMILTEEDLLKFVDSISEVSEYSADKRSNPGENLLRARMDSSNSDLHDTPFRHDMHKTKHTEKDSLLGTNVNSENKLCRVEKTKEYTNITNATMTRDRCCENDNKIKVSLNYNLGKMNKTEPEDSDCTTITNVKDVCNTILSKPKMQVHAESSKSKTLELEEGKLKSESKCKETNIEISIAETGRASHYMKSDKESCVKKTMSAEEKRQPHTSNNMEAFSNRPEEVKLTVNYTCEGTLSPVMKKRADKIDKTCKESNTYQSRCKRKLDCNSVDDREMKKMKEAEQVQSKDGAEKTYTAELWKPFIHISSKNVPPTSDSALQDDCRQGKPMLSSIYPENVTNNLHVAGDDNGDDIDDFLVIPPSNYESDIEIELKDFEGDVSFQDHDFPDTCIPTLEQFRVTSPVRLCVVKLFGKKVIHQTEPSRVHVLGGTSSFTYQSWSLCCCCVPIIIKTFPLNLSRMYPWLRYGVPSPVLVTVM